MKMSVERKVKRDKNNNVMKIDSHARNGSSTPKEF